MKRLILLGCTVCLLARPAAPLLGTVEFSRALLRFHAAYDPFFRKYFGCPPHSVEPADCRPTTGTDGYAEYMRALKLSVDVFPQEKR